METREQAAARAKEYRIRKKVEINARDRKRWKEKRRYDRRDKTIGDKRCAFCEVLLKGRTVGMKQKKYCDGCLGFTFVKRILRNIYMRRWYRKKKGKENPLIEFKPSEWA